MAPGAAGRRVRRRRRTSDRLAADSPLSRIEAALRRAGRDLGHLEILPELRLPVARLGHLIALEVLARDDRTRPQDAIDLAGLLTIADPAAVDLARDVLVLVVARGFHRGRVLVTDLESVLGQFGRERRR